MAGLLGHISQDDREWLERRKDEEGRCGPLGHKTVDDDYDGMYKDTEYTVSFECIKCEIEFELPEEKVKDKQIVCPICKKILQK